MQICIFAVHKRGLKGFMYTQRFKYITANTKLISMQTQANSVQCCIYTYEGTDGKKQTSQPKSIKTITTVVIKKGYKQYKVSQVPGLHLKPTHPSKTFMETKRDTGVTEPPNKGMQ